MSRKPYREFTDEQKFKAKARAKANVYQRRGYLVPEACGYCGEPSQKHHPDYSQALNVQWLCEGCHRAMHVAGRICRKAELSAKCGELVRKYFNNLCETPESA